VMVADNLGAIPPNTSVMIVTSKNKRYQVSLSSSEKQNAKVVIDLKKE
jgi:type IV secretory pathway VirB9-like protein